MRMDKRETKVKAKNSTEACVHVCVCVRVWGAVGVVQGG